MRTLQRNRSISMRGAFIQRTFVAVPSAAGPRDRAGQDILRSCRWLTNTQSGLCTTQLRQGSWTVATLLAEGSIASLCRSPLISTLILFAARFFLFLCPRAESKRLNARIHLPCCHIMQWRLHGAVVSWMSNERTEPTEDSNYENLIERWRQFMIRIDTRYYEIVQSSTETHSYSLHLTTR